MGSTQGIHADRLSLPALRRPRRREGSVTFFPLQPWQHSQNIRTIPSNKSPITSCVLCVATFAMFFFVCLLNFSNQLSPFRRAWAGEGRGAVRVRRGGKGREIRIQGGDVSIISIEIISRPLKKGLSRGKTFLFSPFFQDFCGVG